MHAPKILFPVARLVGRMPPFFDLVELQLEVIGLSCPNMAMHVTGSLLPCYCVTLLVTGVSGEMISIQAPLM